MTRRRIYSGKIVGLSVHDIAIEGRRVRREIIEHPGAAAVLALDPEGRAVLVRQHRFPHGYVLEIPAGTLERGEDPKACAARELMEETGHRAGRLSRLVSYYPSIGYNTEVIHCYLARRAVKVAEIDADNDEFITVVRMDPGRLLRMVLSGRIRDSKTICAVLAHAGREGRLGPRGRAAGRR